ncbi:hypothetical protein JKA74_03220 [Marivirga sp. S37H4]|uniref:Cadherin domain-containing protein n=1 Tax=Marivirga aurantiaca TaxID=2802615 RepID=A0A934WW56_9BACT|nr:hypothetical protein [Marivirga aurantiaca]MBK6264036.1 hypothetical protein [Marivirga aurantiaca]
MKYYFLFILSLFFGFQVFAQNDVNIYAPELIEEEVGKQVVFKVDWTAINKDQYKLTWKSDAPDAKFDLQEMEFYWQPKSNESGLYRATFFIKDSADQIVKKAQTLIKIQTPKQLPRFYMIPDSLNQRPYIKLLQGERYRMEFVATSPTATDEDLILSYILDSNTDLKSFDNSDLHIIGNRLMLDWKPSQEQAERKYFEMELIAVDANNTAGRKKYRFQIIDQNLPPQLRNNINATYIITADQQLEIDFSVTDPDNDPIAYNVEIPVTVGNPNISNSGRFTWSLSTSEMAKINSVFPLDVKLTARDLRHPEDFVEKNITILKSDKNDPPVITKLTNLSVREGYAIKRRVFIRDNNHNTSDLRFELDNEPDWLYLQQEGERLYLMSDTIDYDVVKADGIPVQYDVLFTVTDPDGASDSQFFNVTVNQGVNTVEVYRDLEHYHKETDALLVGLRKQIKELDRKSQKKRNLKNALLFSTFFLGTFSATGSFFDDHTIARQLVPYAGALLAISSSVNALAFNQEGKINSIKFQLEDIEKSIVRNKSYLQTYSVQNETDDELRNTELVNRVQNYRQSLIEQRIELQKLEAEYRELNYVQRRIKRFRRKGKLDEVKWNFLH